MNTEHKIEKQNYLIWFKLFIDVNLVMQTYHQLLINIYVYHNGSGLKIFPIHRFLLKIYSFFFFTFLLVLSEETPEGAEKTVKNDISDEKLSLAWRLLYTNETSSQSFNPMSEEFKESRPPYILNPKYSALTSLPLYFFFGYQFLQESSDLMEQCGPVSLNICFSLWIN